MKTMLGSILVADLLVLVKCQWNVSSTLWQLSLALFCFDAISICHYQPLTGDAWLEEMLVLTGYRYYSTITGGGGDRS